MSRWKPSEEQYNVAISKMLKYYSKYPYNVLTQEELHERLKVIPLNSRRLLEIRWKLTIEGACYNVAKFCELTGLSTSKAQNDFLNSKYVLYFIEPENLPFEMAVKLGKLIYSCYSYKHQYHMVFHNNINFYRLLDCINNLDDKHKDIIIKHYGLDGNKPSTFDYIARETEFSKAYIQKLEKEAFEKLKMVSQRFSNLKDICFCELSDLAFCGRLSNRAYNALRRNGINTIADLKSIKKEELLLIEGIGNKLCAEILSLQETL